MIEHNTGKSFRRCRGICAVAFFPSNFRRFFRRFRSSDGREMGEKNRGGFGGWSWKRPDMKAHAIFSRAGKQTKRCGGKSGAPLAMARNWNIVSRERTTCVGKIGKFPSAFPFFFFLFLCDRDVPFQFRVFVWIFFKENLLNGLDGNFLKFI